MPPPGQCQPHEQRRLQDEVNLACKRPRACNGATNPIDAAIRRDANRECAMARDEVNRRCFMGGDVDHRNAAIDAWQSVANCEGLIP